MITRKSDQLRKGKVNLIPCAFASNGWHWGGREGGREGGGGAGLIKTITDL